MMPDTHLDYELAHSGARVTANTRYGPVTGGRAANDAAVWLEIPYALPPKRFADPEPLYPAYRYEEKDYIKEASYAAQPHRVTADSPEDAMGNGSPTENTLFANIVSPPSFPAQDQFPVKLYVHGGFLQFGSPHGLKVQAQYVSAARSEVWVNIGYRLSAFGYLGADKPLVPGNFGFKDIWIACQWVKENISAFGGNPDDITIVGLSGGAHAIHQVLQHVSRLPARELSPFHTAILQSNAIISNSKPLALVQDQYEAVCRGLGLDPALPDTLSIISDPSRTAFSAITDLIDSGKLGKYGTFRSCLEPGWYNFSSNETFDVMDWQRNGGFAKGLTEKGVKKVVVGEVKDEWYFYSSAHEVANMEDIKTSLERYYGTDDVEKMVSSYEPLPHDAPLAEFRKLFGRIISDGQVHLPVRVLARDLQVHGFPVLRYQIRWTPEQDRKCHGYVTHGTDRALWAYRLPTLQPDQATVASTWLDAIDERLASLNSSNKALNKVLTLKEDRSIGWTIDERWEDCMRIVKNLEGL